MLVPQLEAVGEEHNVALSSPDSPSLQAFQRIGKVFHEFDSDSAAMVVLEGDQPLGADAHRYYDELVKRFEADTKHVQHVQDFWGDPLTAAGAQSPDGKAAYVQVFLSGNQGEALSLESVDALRDIIAKTPAPPGIHAYVAGSAAQIADQFEVGNESTVLVTLLTVGVIAMMLLIVYRSLGHHDPGARHGAHRDVGGPRDRLVPGELRLHRPVDVFDQHPHAAGHRRRHRLHDLPARPLSRDAATRAWTARSPTTTCTAGTSHVILGSGLTIAGAVFCLYFTRLPYFQSLGIPAAIGVLVVAGRLADAGARGDRDRQPLRAARAQAQDGQAGLAADRDGDRAVARARS